MLNAIRVPSKSNSECHQHPRKANLGHHRQPHIWVPDSKLPLRSATLSKPRARPAHCLKQGVPVLALHLPVIEDCVTVTVTWWLWHVVYDLLDGFIRVEKWWQNNRVMVEGELNDMGRKAGSLQHDCGVMAAREDTAQDIYKWSFGYHFWWCNCQSFILVSLSLSVWHLMHCSQAAQSIRCTFSSPPILPINPNILPWYPYILSRYHYILPRYELGLCPCLCPLGWHT